MRIPNVDGHWLWGSIGPFQKAPYLFPWKASREKGGVARFRLLHRQFVAVSDPELYDQMMVKSPESFERGYHFRNQHVLFGRGMISTEGDEWSKKRVRGAPAFNREAMSRMVPLSVRTANRYLSTWLSHADAGQSISLVPEMQKLTISIICQSLFSVDIDSENAVRFCDAIRDSGGIIRRKNTSVVPLPLWVPTKANAELKSTRRTMNDFVLDKIAKRNKLRESGIETHDILEVLLGSRKLEEMSEPEAQELIDECKTFLVAGFETTALTLTWALFHLTLRPDIAEKWHDECDRVLGDGDPAWEDLEKLAYTRQILFETLRFYPVVYTQPRECVKDERVGDYKFKKGEVLLLSIFGMHRSPKHWSDPDSFDPDRFGPGKIWPRKSYMPFGKGKHTCLGNNFAIYEMLVILSMIGKRFTLSRADDQEIGIRSTIVLVPDRDIHIKLRKRK